MISVEKAIQLKEHRNIKQLCPLHRSISDSDLRAFIALSKEAASIHRPESENPIVPGNLLLALLPSMLQSGLSVRQSSYCLTTRYARTRFLNVVHPNQELALSYSISSCKFMGGKCLVGMDISLERTEDQRVVLTTQQVDCYID